MIWLLLRWLSWTRATTAQCSATLLLMLQNTLWWKLLVHQLLNKPLGECGFFFDFCKILFLCHLKTIHALFHAHACSLYLNNSGRQLPSDLLTLTLTLVLFQQPQRRCLIWQLSYSQTCVTLTTILIAPQCGSSFNFRGCEILFLWRSELSMHYWLTENACFLVTLFLKHAWAHAHANFICPTRPSLNKDPSALFSVLTVLFSCHHFRSHSFLFI